MKQICSLMAAIGMIAGCSRTDHRPAELTTPDTGAADTASTVAIVPAGPDPCSVVLVPHAGTSRADREVARCQEKIRAGINTEAYTERLGWAFVAKARESFDSGYYTLAEQCARCLDARAPGSAEAMLLRGHVLQNLHQFNEAEPIARELAAKRGLPADYGLLGDVLMELGRLDEAVEAYQKMMDLKPDPQAYTRAAHVRWLKGDLDGAVELMQIAAGATSPRDSESAAWTHSRLASLQFLSGATEEAERACNEALALRPDYPPALLLRGRMLLAGDDPDAAVEVLKSATRLNPQPEYEWTLAEGFRAAGQEQEAAELEARLRAKGAAADPRTFSLYLATRGEEVELAVRLAEQELQQRQDVFTLDALAWALAAAGRLDEARPRMNEALAAGTEDARLLFHAAVIHSKSGQSAEAIDWFSRAAVRMHALLPSEQAQLKKIVEDMAGADPASDDPLPQSTATPFSAPGS